MSREQPVLLSALPPTRRQERLALAVAVLVLIAFLAILPFWKCQLPREDAFIPIVDTLLFGSDLTTAALLFAQFSVARSRALLVLATGYFFTCLIIVPHLLTFPDVFAPTGLLGARFQSTAWLWIFWHLGLPSSVLAFAFLKGEPNKRAFDQSSVGAAILGSIIAATALTLCLTWLAIGGVGFLPAVMTGDMHANFIWSFFVAPAILVFCLTAWVLLWRRRSSVLDLWLLLALWAWTIESLLQNLTFYRFSLVWYAGRAFGVLASGFVLLVLLSQLSALYRRLALSVGARDRERLARQMTLEVIMGSVAHDLQQPLFAIALNSEAAATELAKIPPNFDDLRASVVDIAIQGRRASEIVASTRKLFSGAAPLLSALDIDPLIIETLELLRIELRIHDVALRLNLESQLPRVQGNRVQLSQVVINLIVNAIDSMAAVTDRPRLLTIQSKRQAADAVSIEVKDSGAGIPAENLARIFDPFFTTKSHGTGLGLQICRSIVEEHGGRITVSAGEQYGCIFRVVLPIVLTTPNSLG